MTNMHRRFQGLASARAVSSLAGLILLVLAVLVFAPPAGARSDGPRDTVEAFHQTLLAVMKDAERLKFAGRYEKLEPVIESRFHLPLMAGIASGKYWRRAEGAQRRKLVDAFKRMSVGTYAARFDGYSGESFETLSDAPGPRGTVLVRTQINRPDDSPVKLTYVTKKFDGGWRIVDILLDGGISELAVRQSEYRRILGRDGVDGLIKSLNRGADKLLGR